MDLKITSFAPAHGKGENNGFGGDVKNGMSHKLLQMKVVLQDVEDFVEVATKKFLRLSLSVA